MIDTCASEFDSYVPYFYSTYEEENESVVSDKKKIIVLGSGPIRIGQGVEFDYSTVHAIWSIREAGYEAIIINNNPETVSTDYTTSDKLYFEPLTVEDVMNVITLLLCHSEVRLLLTLHLLLMHSVFLLSVLMLRLLTELKIVTALKRLWNLSVFLSQRDLLLPILKRV